jgi:CRP/FNR family transcriptional regulator
LQVRIKLELPTGNEYRHTVEEVTLQSPMNSSPGADNFRDKAAFPAALRDVEDVHLKRLLESGTPVRLEANRFIFRPGDSCESFLILLDGRIRVQLISEEGKEVTLYRIGPGGSCVLTTSCLFSSEHYPAEAIAETDIEALAFSRELFEQTVEVSTHFRRFVFDGFSQRLARVIGRMEELAFTSIDYRLARALVDLHEREQTQVTHNELAVELGTAREVVSRHLKKMEARGLIALGRGQVTVLDLPELSRIARNRSA